MGRPDWMAQAEMFEEVLENTPPVFDKRTEEGLRYRVYRIGSIEVRTTQAVDGKEVVGAVFSKCRASNSAIVSEQAQRMNGAETVVKATMHVERDRRSLASRRYYVVLETETAGKIVTEMHSDATVTWKENPEKLEVRSFLSKTFRA